MSRLVLAMSLLAVLPAVAAEPLNTTFFGHRAANGYDVVAYFSDGAAVPGKGEFSVQHKGATWLFASAEHRDRFKANPSSFEPQYGGFCAYAMARGEKVGTDPTAWAIVDGKLYLNYSKSVQAKWQEDRTGFITRADEQWKRLIGSP